MSNWKWTAYTKTSPRLLSAERALILCDAHQQLGPDAAERLLSCRPSLILIGGDWLEADEAVSGRERALELLGRLAAVCPTYVGIGNHEMGTRGRHQPCGQGESTPLTASQQALMGQMTVCGATVLHDRFVRHGSLSIGALTSAAGRKLATDWLSEMEREEGFRLLLCHHPEYYEPYLRGRDLDLTVSGHAHGGQWRFFGRGVYAPGQGLFPRYTAGYYDGERLLVSRGLAGRWPVPRLFNPKEAIVLDLIPEDKEGTHL